MTKRLQSREALETQLQDQLGFLHRSADAYDDGHTEEAKRLAATIRILVHDTKNSTSLLTQLNEKTRRFYDSSVPDVEGNVMPYGGLVQVAAGLEGATYLPFLDDPLPRGVRPRAAEFEMWWTTPIIRTVDGDVFSRRDLILCVADQDGGAHVDPKLDDSYARLSRERGMGWQHEGPQGLQVVRPGDRAAVRQIAHEVLKTFDASIEKHPKPPPGTLFNIGSSEVVISGAEVLVTNGAERRLVPVELVVKHESRAAGEPSRQADGKVNKPFRAPARPGRNAPCPCGSGKKWKRCHGR